MAYLKICLLIGGFLFSFSQKVYGESAEKVFTDIYQNGIWGRDQEGQGTSGHGSRVKYALTYIKYIQDFLRDFEVGSIVDLGCGDWVLAHEIKWEGRSYLGIDVVQKLIEKNRTLFGTGNIQFLSLDAGTMSLPDADLLICKDVLQHLPYREIFHILSQVKKYKYVIFVNDIDRNNRSINTDIPIGSYRPLNLAMHPFNLKASQTIAYQSGTEIKQIFLIVNP